MDISTIANTAGQAISTLDGALENKPTGLSRLILAYAPRIIREFVIDGRLRLHQLRHHEEAFEAAFKTMQETRKKLIESTISSETNTPLLRVQLIQLEKEYRLLKTVHLAFPYLEKDSTMVDDSTSEIEAESENVWWDMFEDLASRRNESWRVDLFAKSIAENDKFPSSISLKALWEIAMMEVSDFAALSVFCDSSLYIDGKPITIMEPEEQYRYESDLNDSYSGNLALCINSLVDKNLIQKVSTQFMTSDPVELVHKSGTTFLHHSVEGIFENTETAIRIEGYSPTDHCLDICKLYHPNLNIASDRNLLLLQEQLYEQVNQAEDGEPKNNFGFVKKND